MEHQKTGPGRYWYAVAVLIFLFGIGSGIWMIVQAVTGIPDNLVRVMVPGSTKLDLKETGTYTIYHEYRTYLDGQLYETQGSISGLACTVLGESGSENVSVIPSNMNETYSIGTREGEAIYKFSIQDPGSYYFSAAYSDGRSQPRAMLAIGQNIVGNILLAVFAPLTIIGTCSVLAAIIAIVVLVKRSQAKSSIKSGIEA